MMPEVEINPVLRFGEALYCKYRIKERRRICAILSA